MVYIVISLLKEVKISGEEIESSNLWPLISMTVQIYKH